MGLFVFKVTVRMLGMNGYPHRWSLSLIHAFTDGLLIPIGMLLGAVIRFGGAETNILRSDHFYFKVIVFTLIIQILFYYFELYDLRIFRTRLKMSILLAGSLGTSFVLLAVLSYMIPALALGRGMLSINMILIFFMAFLWRRVFASIGRRLIRERVLIVGTGELSKKIANEIYENGQESFEIIGFVAE